MIAFAFIGNSTIIGTGCSAHFLVSIAAVAAAIWLYSFTYSRSVARKVASGIFLFDSLAHRGILECSPRGHRLLRTVIALDSARYDRARPGFARCRPVIGENHQHT